MGWVFQFEFEFGFEFVVTSAEGWVVQFEFVFVVMRRAGYISPQAEFEFEFELAVFDFVV